MINSATDDVDGVCVFGSVDEPTTRLEQMVGRGRRFVETAQRI